MGNKRRIGVYCTVRNNENPQKKGGEFSGMDGVRLRTRCACDGSNICSRCTASAILNDPRCPTLLAACLGKNFCSPAVDLSRLHPATCLLSPSETEFAFFVLNVGESEGIDPASPGGMCSETLAQTSTRSAPAIPNLRPRVRLISLLLFCIPCVLMV